MNQVQSSFPIVLYGRSRRFTWLLAALVALLLAAVVPILGIAQASRQEPDAGRGTTSPYPTPAPEIDRPATITLGALIEVQRRERERRQTLAVAEQAVTELPRDKGWQAQLGAFSSPEAAERQRARLIDAGVPAVIESAGALHRLHSRPASRDDTEGLCARARASGVDCFVRRVI